MDESLSSTSLRQSFSSSFQPPPSSSSSSSSSSTTPASSSSGPQSLPQFISILAHDVISALPVSPQSQVATETSHSRLSRTEETLMFLFTALGVVLACCVLVLCRKRVARCFSRPPAAFPVTPRHAAPKSIQPSSQSLSRECGIVDTRLHDSANDSVGVTISAETNQCLTLQHSRLDSLFANTVVFERQLFVV